MKNVVSVLAALVIVSSAPGCSEVSSELGPTGGTDVDGKATTARNERPSRGSKLSSWRTSRGASIPR
jgi:hypothetical protein